MRKEKVNGIVNNMQELKEQNTLLKEVRNSCTGKVINRWHEITEDMTTNIFKFARKALIFSLPTNTNLNRWKKTTTDECPLCNRKQTQLHVLNNCATAANDGRYTWRHDSILYTIMHYINQLANEGYEIYADLNGYKSTSELFNRLRPDIAVKKGDTVQIIELTCCFETNLEKSNRYKKEKYKNLEKDLNIKVKLIKSYIEVTSLGFTPKTNNTIDNLLKKYGINFNRFNKKMCETALRCSYYLFTQRNKTWSDKDILKFY
jgi:hypothetical protein